MNIVHSNKSITIYDTDSSNLDKILKLLETNFNITITRKEKPKLSELTNWSEKIPFNATSKQFKNYKDFTRSGVYKIWYKDELIYIGETRCDKTINPSTRPGMWARRGDFKSTILGGDSIRNPYGNGTAFLQNFSLEDLSDVYHTFHYVPAEFCKEIELELLKEYYEQHNKLPLIQSEHDYVRIGVV